MNVDWDRICDFVFDTFGDDNAEMARYTITEFGINPDTRRPTKRVGDGGDADEFEEVLAQLDPHVSEYIRETRRP